MSKLHELLAVEKDLHGQADACRADLKGTFEKKAHHFTKKVVTLKSLKDSVSDKVESQLNLETTVRKELKWIAEKLAKAIDLGHHIDIANITAASDVVLEDGTILLKSVPTTSLLRLQHRVTEVRDLVHAIPTLDPAKNFVEDRSEGDDIYKADPAERRLGEKQFRFIVMVPPTDKHPAQVKELMEDVPISISLTQEWSSLLTVGGKGDMLDRVEDVLRAIKKARARANEMEIDVRQNKIGDAVLGYIFSGGTK